MTETTFFLIGLIGLIACSAFFSGSETAMFSLSSIQIRKFHNRKRGSGPIVARLISRPRNLLISLLIGNMTVNIFTSSLSASFFRRVLGTTSLAHLSGPLTVIVMTVLIIIFGEITPKTFAIQNSERVSLRVAPIINALYTIVAPIRYLLFRITNGIILLAGKLIGTQETSVSPDELKIAATLGHSAGAIAQQEKELIHGVLRLEHRRVQEMMTTRMDVKAFDISTPLDEIRRTVREMYYMRIPVYDGELDNIRGILYAKDLLLVRRMSDEEVKLADIIKPAYFVPETLDVDVLLEEFKKRRTHLALVVDEYGSISGLITLEDVLELIVGNIYDKVDEARLYHMVDDHTIQVKNLMPIEDFNEVFRTEISDEYVVTMGGFVTHMLGRIPQKDEVFRITDLEFRILRAGETRIEEMLVRRIGPRKRQ
jgi:CBS domain containing-hemolysin-like protein